MPCLDSSPQSQTNVSSWDDFPNSPCDQQVSPASQNLYALCTPYIRPLWGLPKPLFWLELTNPAQEHQSTHTWTLLKAWVWGSVSLPLSVLSLNHPMWSLKARYVLPPGPVSDRLLCFNFSFLIFLILILIFGCVGSSLLRTGFSLAAASWGYSSLWHTGFSLRWLLLLQSMGCTCAGFSSCGSRALKHRLSSCGAGA